MALRKKDIDGILLRRRVGNNIIYVVEGSCGEYDDYQNWSVLAFKKKEHAEQWAELCQEKADELYSLYRNAYEIPLRPYDKPNYDLNPYDPWMSVDYTGTKYKVTELEYEE